MPKGVEVQVLSDAPMKIILASQESCEAFKPQLNKLLELLGFPEALVTDESRFLDFLSVFEFETVELASTELNRILFESGLRVELSARMTLIEGVRAIIELYPDWPLIRIQ